MSIAVPNRQNLVSGPNYERNPANAPSNQFVVHFSPTRGEPPQVQVAQPVEETKKSLIRRFAEKIWTAVKWVFKIALGVGLFIFNSSFFAVGFIVGLIFNDKIKPAIEKISLVWEKQSLAVGALIGVGAFLALPVTLAAAATLYGAVIGSKLSNDAQTKGEAAETPAATAT